MSVDLDVPVTDEARVVRRMLRCGLDAVVKSPESVRAQLAFLIAASEN